MDVLQRHGRRGRRLSAGQSVRKRCGRLPTASAVRRNRAGAGAHLRNVGTRRGVWSGVGHAPHTARRATSRMTRPPSSVAVPSLTAVMCPPSLPRPRPNSPRRPRGRFGAVFGPVPVKWLPVTVSPPAERARTTGAWAFSKMLLLIVTLRCTGWAGSRTVLVGAGWTDAERCAADGEVGDRPRLVPLLGVGGDLDAGPGHAVEEVVLDDDRPPGGHQDPAGGHVDEVVADDVDRGGGRDVLGDPVLRGDGVAATGGPGSQSSGAGRPRRPGRADRRRP